MAHGDIQEASGGKGQWEGRITTVVSFSENELLNPLIPSQETDTWMLWILSHGYEYVFVSEMVYN